MGIAMAGITFRAGLSKGGEGDRFALTPPAGEVPGVGKAGALAWFGRVNAAGSILQKNAAAVVPLFQGQPRTIRQEFGVAVCKFIFGEIQKPGEPLDISAV